MEIDRALNLVFPIRFAEVPDPQDATFEAEKRAQKTMLEPSLWAYHCPIAQDVFRANYRVWAATKDQIFTKYTADTAFEVAGMILRDCAQSDAEARGMANLGPAILGDIRRLTSVLMPGAQGFEMVPADVAMNHNRIQAEEWEYAENAIVFFTCLLLVNRAKRPALTAGLVSAIKGSMTSLSPTDYGASLAISTQVATSVKTPASSVPS